MSGVAPQLRLYARVLRLHRQKLPAMQRSIGDEYVKKEFRAHQQVEAGSEFHAPFMKAWEDYCEQLDAFRPLEGSQGWTKEGIREQVRLGKDLTEEQVAAMSEEQRQQVAKLKTETLDAADKLYNES